MENLPACLREQGAVHWDPRTDGAEVGSSLELLTGLHTGILYHRQKNWSNAILGILAYNPKGTFTLNNNRSSPNFSLINTAIQFEEKHGHRALDSRQDTGRMQKSGYTA